VRGRNPQQPSENLPIIFRCFAEIFRFMPQTLHHSPADPFPAYTLLSGKSVGLRRQREPLATDDGAFGVEHISPKRRPPTRSGLPPHSTPSRFRWLSQAPTIEIYRISNDNSPQSTDPPTCHCPKSSDNRQAKSLNRQMRPGTYDQSTTQTPKSTTSPDRFLSIYR
jgi:hypothetical protein